MKLFVIIISLWIILGVITAPHTYPINPKKKTCRTVCSLTTRPFQPYYFKDVLDSLVEQFDAVYLTLPYISHKGIKYPEISHPGVTIVRPEKDYGPITKFFGPLDIEKDPDTLIVILDDDVVYKPNTRRQYMREHLKYPGCVLSGSGIIYKYSNIHWLLSISPRRNNMSPILPSFVGSNHTTTVVGSCGIAFERNLLDKFELLSFMNIWCENYRDCFINDDIVISAYFSQKKITRLLVNVDNSGCRDDKDTESLSGLGQNIFASQHRAYCIMKECFIEPHRIDCICLVDIFIITVILYLSIRNYNKGDQGENFQPVLKV